VLFDRVIGGPLYDIGGARLVMEEVPQAYDVRSASVFAKHQDITRKAGLFGGL